MGPVDCWNLWNCTEMKWFTLLQFHIHRFNRIGTFFEWLLVWEYQIQFEVSKIIRFIDIFLSKVKLPSVCPNLPIISIHSMNIQHSRRFGLCSATPLIYCAEFDIKTIVICPQTYLCHKFYGILCHWAFKLSELYSISSKRQTQLAAWITCSEYCAYRMRTGLCVFFIFVLFR